MDASKRQSILITGSNRGLGLGLVQRYLRAGYVVHAAMRNPDGAREVWELEHAYPGRCHIVQLDVTSDEDISKLRQSFQDKTLDAVINNAAVAPSVHAPWQDVTNESMLTAYRVNTLGPLSVIQALWPALERSQQPLIANISSIVGSIAGNEKGGLYAYRAAKSALNMITKNLSLDLPRAILVALHPGWVATDMGGPQAPISVEESVNGLFQVLQGLKRQDSGRFLDFQGQELSW